MIGLKIEVEVLVGGFEGDRSGKRVRGRFDRE